MEELEAGWKLANVRRYMEISQPRRDDPIFRNRVLVVSRGRYDDVALVPLRTDGRGSFGCPEVQSMVLLRNAEFAGDDHELAAVVAAGGGHLRLATTFDDDGVREEIDGAAVVLAWRAHKVFRVIDAAARQAAHRPSRVVADPCAPDYGRWPAPSLAWVSVAEVIDWERREPYRTYHRRGGGTKLRDAVAAFGWPALGRQEQSLTKALAIAALLRGTAWMDGTLPPPSSLARFPDPVMSLIGIREERVYGLDADGRWRLLFCEGGDDADVRLLEIEQATAHARMASARAGKKGVDRPAS